MKVYAYIVTDTFCIRLSPIMFGFKSKTFRRNSVASSLNLVLFLLGQDCNNYFDDPVEAL